MSIFRFVSCATVSALVGCAAPVQAPQAEQGPVADSVIAKQHELLVLNTAGKGFGPQSPRDIDSAAGSNSSRFTPAPAVAGMNLCNIHFHKNAEHRGGEFTKYAGNGDGHGNESGYLYVGQLSAAELKETKQPICPSNHGGVVPGETIEWHYVYSTAQVGPGATLGACFSDADKNPQLRVEAQVGVLVNDRAAHDFVRLTQHEIRNGVHQAVNLPSDTGVPVRYAGSTTGPGFNMTGSPFQVTWSVRPKVIKVDIESVGRWCKGNAFKEDHAHGVRNLVRHPDLLSRIER